MRITTSTFALFGLMLLCSCASRSKQASAISDYRISSGTTVYCWFAEDQKTGLRGYTYNDIGRRGYVPPLGTPFATLWQVGTSIQKQGASSIVLAPFYPADVPPGWVIRGLSADEQSTLALAIPIQRIEKP